MDETLFLEDTPWAESIAERVLRRMPPSFDIDDLKQVARIEHWHRVELFDSSRGVPYRAYAYFPIRGAVLMACRRKNYREATHEQLPVAVIDVRQGADAILLDRERQRNVLGPRAYRQLEKVREALDHLSAVDAYLVRRIYLEAADEAALAALWNVDLKQLARRLHRAVAQLKRAVGSAR